MPMRRPRSLSTNISGQPSSTSPLRRFASLRRLRESEASGETEIMALNNSPSLTNTQQQVHIRLVPNVGTSRCFVFDVIDQFLIAGTVLKMGRYSERLAGSDRLSFKSKVVSRCHAELCVDADGRIHLRDTGSSSGTFVNRRRLSVANTRSEPHPLQDGDMIQLGVDYKGGDEPVYRAIKMVLEINRTPQTSERYRQTVFQKLVHSSFSTSPVDESDVQECCICLYAIGPIQALFISPCSHVFHYRCLHPLLTENHPGFSCPLCRTYSDLDASVAGDEYEIVATAVASPTTAGFSNLSSLPIVEETIALPI